MLTFSSQACKCVLVRAKCARIYMLSSTASSDMIKVNISVCLVVRRSQICLYIKYFIWTSHTTHKSLESRDEQMYEEGENHRLKVAQESGKSPSIAFQCFKQLLPPCSFHLIYPLPRMLYPQTVMIVSNTRETNIS